MGKDGEKEAMKCPQDEGGKQRKKLGRPTRVVQKNIQKSRGSTQERH